jgi:hypothetical protein
VHEGYHLHEGDADRLPALRAGGSIHQRLQRAMADEARQDVTGGATAPWSGETASGRAKREMEVEPY